MTKNKSRDKALILTILKNQQKIKDAIKFFKCTEYNLDQNDMAFDLCAMYMAQIGESAKLLTDDTKSNLTTFDWRTIKYFRDFIDHVYEKINKKTLKPYIFLMTSPKVTNELKDVLKQITQELNNEKNEIEEHDI